MNGRRRAVVFAWLLAAWPGLALAQNPIVTETLLPTHDTWATHDDGLVHGFEPTIEVGIEPQACQPGGSYNPCEDDGLTCCTAADGYNYCAEPGACATTTPSWSAYRKFRGYLRFDLSELPQGKVLKATLRLVEKERVEDKGGPVKVFAYRLKSIGPGDDKTCAWDEGSLNDSEGTTWSSLPQNTLFNEADNAWSFDVTKALVDWLEGDPDIPDAPPADNCGFVLHDPDFGKANAPLQRWVIFWSKEGDVAPQLSVSVALDLDGDGFTGDVDCDEEDQNVNPSVPEVCNDGVDNDCDGAIDNEACDGLDNDCDGHTDEGDPAVLCGAGQVCVLGSCELTCVDECEGPTDKMCAQLEGGGWQVLGCGQDDDDPCLDWFQGEACPAGWNCTYGSCSTNCVDECDTEDDLQCAETPSGAIEVQICADGDGNGCLGWEPHEACAPGMTCEAGACTGASCTDECPAAGETQCDGDLIQSCYFHDGPSMCLTWSEPSPCPAGECIDGVCTDEDAVVEPGSDAGATDAGTADAGSADAGTADVITGTDAGSTDTGAPPMDTGGGSEDTGGVAPPNDTAGGGADQTGGGGGQDAAEGGDTAIGADTGAGAGPGIGGADAGSDAVFASDALVDEDVAGEGGDDDAGCDCRANSGGSPLRAEHVLLVSALAAVVVGLRRRHTAPPAP